MALPEGLQAGIDELTGGVDPRELARTARTLSEAYRAGGPPASRAVRTAGEVTAYLATRAPATYAAVAEVLRQIGLARPGWEPTSVLDLGAGPGVAAWAAVERWPGVTTVRLVEAEPEMVRAGKSLAAHGGEALRTATWIVADAGAAEPAGGSGDRVVPARRARAGNRRRSRPARMETYDRHARDHRARDDRGIPARDRGAYRRDRGRRLDARAVPARHTLSASRGGLVPFRDASAADPDAPASERGRTRLRGREVLVCRAVPVASAAAREGACCGAPISRPGHVVLDVCAPSGIDRRIVSRREGDAYRRARKLEWGDAV